MQATVTRAFILYTTKLLVLREGISTFLPLYTKKAFLLGINLVTDL
jgi:hypothetical protein